MPLKGFITKVLTYIFKSETTRLDHKCESADPVSRTAFSIEDGSKKRCYYCNGKGVILEKSHGYLDETGYPYRHLEDLIHIQESIECPICKGNGYLNS